LLLRVLQVLHTTDNPEVFLDKKAGTKQAEEQKPSQRRSEKAGITHFTKDMISALAMALVAIVYVIQAFKIPSGSMEDSLLVGDFLLGLKFIYGAPVLPFMYTKFPGVTNPKPGDVIIFKYPGTDKKDYIKRCVAGPGDTVQIDTSRVMVNHRPFVLPPKGKYILGGLLDSSIANFAPLRVPTKGDTLRLGADVPCREFLYYKHLVKQENPRTPIAVKYQLYINGAFANNQKVLVNGYWEIPFGDIDFNKIDNWLEIDKVLRQVPGQFPDKTVEIRKLLYLNNNLVTQYIVKNDNYFMMGDNRDNSTDSRYWGFLNRNFVKAKAFILYFSWDGSRPLWDPLKIRWNRIGRLIRSWDGTRQIAGAR
jgi:signal peptidase I